MQVKQSRRRIERREGMRGGQGWREERGRRGRENGVGCKLRDQIQQQREGDGELEEE